MSPALNQAVAIAASSPGAGTKLAQIAKRTLPILGARILGMHWPLFSGKNITGRALEQLIAREWALPPRVSDRCFDRARAAIRYEFMTAEESAAYAALVATRTRLPVYRARAEKRSSGWYTSREDALAALQFHQPAHVVEASFVTTDEFGILAVKTVAGRTEIVVSPAEVRMLEIHTSREEVRP